MHRLSDEERMKTKEKFNFHFKKCPRPLTRECPLTRKREYRIQLGSINGNRRNNLESCPLTRVFVSGEFTVKITFNTYQFLNAFQRR